MPCAESLLSVEAVSRVKRPVLRLLAKATNAVVPVALMEILCVMTKKMIDAPFSKIW